MTPRGVVWLVRHAPTTWTGFRFCGRSDPPLGADGRRVAASVAIGLHALVAPGTPVVTSPLRRAAATAAPIARALGVRPQRDAAWCEADMGAVDGRTFDEVERMWPDVAHALLRGAHVDWPDGERHVELVDRVLGAWSRVCLLPGETVVVTHGGPIRVVRAALGADGDPIAPGTVLRVDERGVSMCPVP